MKQFYLFGNYLQVGKIEDKIDLISRAFPSLEDLTLHGNPIIEGLDDGGRGLYGKEVKSKLKMIAILDGQDI